MYRSTYKWWRCTGNECCNLRGCSYAEYYGIKVMGIKNGEVFDMDIFEALNTKTSSHNDLIELSKMLSYRISIDA